MPKVITERAYAHPWWGERFNCTHCQSELEFVPDDEKTMTTHYGQRDGIEGYSIACPVCGAVIWLGKWKDMPQEQSWDR